MARLSGGGMGRGFLLRAIIYWFPVAFAVSVLAALIYGAVQQNYRQSANDPQIQMAEDAAAHLEAGQQPQAIVGAAKIDISRSLSPFLIVYDDAAQPVASSATLNGQTPLLPSGVFQNVRQSGEERLSWQPQDGVRSAAVVLHYGGAHPGFVLAGRSLREVENRESQLTTMVGAAWAVALVGSLLLLVFAVWVNGKLARRA